MRKFLVLLAILTVAVPLSAQWRRAALSGADVRALIIDPASPGPIRAAYQQLATTIDTHANRSRLAA